MSLKTKLWGSAEDLFLTSRYAALTGERIQSTQPSHQTQKRKKSTTVYFAGVLTVGTVIKATVSPQDGIVVLTKTHTCSALFLCRLPKAVLITAGVLVQLNAGCPKTLKPERQQFCFSTLVQFIHATQLFPTPSRFCLPLSEYKSLRPVTISLRKIFIQKCCHTFTSNKHLRGFFQKTQHAFTENTIRKLNTHLLKIFMKTNATEH